MISPCDGKILTFGKIDLDGENNDNNDNNGNNDNTGQYEPTLEQIKGVPYNLRQFLGEIPELTNKISNNLYYCIIYLGPGDYHRFHSCCHWECNEILHVPGDLYAVKPSWLRKIPGLFSLNERVVLKGKWSNWVFNEETQGHDQESLFFSYIPVGAFNVGSIVLNFDDKIKTNQKEHDDDVWYRTKKPAMNSDNDNENENDNKNENVEIKREPPYGKAFLQTPWVRDYFLQYVPSLNFSKGQELGYFNFGSTIVLVFESKDFEFCVHPGQTIRYGTAIGDRKYE